jgi:3-oxoacyl-[acyl-carrier protein] reductase
MGVQREQRPAALVVGGLRGIGLAISQHLCAAGYDVYATTRGSSAPRSSAEREGPKSPIQTVVLDINDACSVDAAHQLFRANGIVPKILIANAGIIHDQIFPTCDFDKWVNVLTTNLIGNARVIRAFVPDMVKAKTGRIIIISSIAGIRGNIGQTAYSASKGGLIAFTKALAREIGRFGIRVNAVSPGIIHSDMSATIPEKLRDERIATSALLREGTVDEVAQVVLLLCGPGGDYVAGQNIVVDGGIVMQ